MGCGDDIPGKRIPHFREIPFQGTMEHLCIQADFLTQFTHLPKVEYSIPAAGSTPTNDGYADIVALATKQIWEIKPEHRVGEAVEEARFYVEKAGASCGLGWKAGLGYKPSGVFVDDPSVVFRTLDVGDIQAELYAYQPEGKALAGAVLYGWRMRNRKKKELSAHELFWARRSIMDTFFPLGGVPVKPNDPYGPQTDIGLAIPRMDDEHSAFSSLSRSLLVTAAKSLPRYVEGGAFQISVEKSIFDNVVKAASRAAGEAKIRQLKADARVLPDAVVRMTTITLVAGTIYASGALGVAVYLAGEYVGVPVSIGIAARVAASARAAASAAAPLIELSPLAAKAAVSTAAVSGSLMLFVPKDALAHNADNQATPITASCARFDLLNPAQARNASVGRTNQYDGGEWSTIAVIRYN